MIRNLQRQEFSILATVVVLLCLAGAASAQTDSGAARNLMHCGLRPSGLTEADVLDYASRMGYEWVSDADPISAHNRGLKTVRWTGNGYGPESLGTWMVNLDWPRWAALCPIDTYAQFHTPYWLCVQCADARGVALEDMENRLNTWPWIDALFFDSAAMTICTKCQNPVNCTSQNHMHEFGNIVDAKAKFIGEVRDQAYVHNTPMMANIWDGRDWVSRFMSRPDYVTFEPDTFYVETGPLGWSSIFDYIEGKRLVFQARDRQGMSLTHNASEYLECAGVIAVHGAWFGYQNCAAEPEDPPVFSDCTAEINLLRTLPNWDNLNGAVSRQLLYPTNLARDAVAGSTLQSYNGRIPSRAIDGVAGVNLDDGWTGAAKQGTIELSFSSPVTVGYIRVIFGDPAVIGIKYTISAFDGSSWFTLASVKSNTQTLCVHELATPVTISKLRYTCTLSAHPTNVYLQEIEVYSGNPVSAQEYRSEFSKASESLVYSIHPNTGQAFVVFADPYATFDVNRVITGVRRATNTWADSGDGSAGVIIEGTSMRLKVPRRPSMVAGSAFIVSF